MLFSRLIKCGTRLALALIIGLATVGSLPVPAQAQSAVVNLELGSEEATSWNIDKIEPGDSGTKTVELHNAGSRKGSVTIWISDIEEVDYGGDGAVLDHYLVFNLSCDRLSTNMTFPSTIRELPQSASDANYVEIGRLNHGQTITLTWHWEFLELGEAQNEAQGDCLSFTINYLLEELPPDDGGEGDSEPRYRILNVDILGKVTKCKVSSSGKLLYSYLAADPDNKHKMELDKGTKVTCATGKVPRKIEMRICEESLSRPDGTAIIGPAYDLIGYIYDSVSCSVIFNQPARLTLCYDPSWLPENTSLIIIASYDTVQGWRELAPSTGSVTELEEVSASINHTSTFVILAKLAPSLTLPPPLLPCHFVVSNLTVKPSLRAIWQPITFMTRIGASVTISANIANDGGQQGTYIVELKINGNIVDIKEVTLEAGQNQQVSFTLSGMDYGQYKVQVAGLSSEFTVSRTINWWLITGIIVAIGLITRGVIWGRRKKKAIQNE